MCLLRGNNHDFVCQNIFTESLHVKRPAKHRHNRYKKGWYDEKNRILAGQAGSISIVPVVHDYDSDFFYGCGFLLCRLAPVRACFYCLLHHPPSLLTTCFLPGLEGHLDPVLIQVLLTVIAVISVFLFFSVSSRKRQTAP